MTLRFFVLPLTEGIPQENFASCVLLLTLSWRTSTGLPVRTLNAENCAQCSMLFKSLLLNITELLNNGLLCYAIPSDKVALRSNADTVLTCAPVVQNSGCIMQRNSSFSESECLRNIMKDLGYYAAAIESYLNFPLRSSVEEKSLLKPTLGMIQTLRKNCSLMPDAGNDSSEDPAQMWGNASFDNRQEMCKMMRGFHIRTITINRAMGYISSGDHMK
ncbi:interleukin-12 subunit alpha-like [Scomber japonicus]|uniref:interleukin-12 subunit alpha-like n=1 Tax=Scomber japonicus TaxID=13676 RepID=UPI0023066606|nr:interleukin-12 subunit alpha-like [Scomber japonicus]